ncbi:MAG: hypothetical protein MUF36_03665 [Bacteroidales bacterium]|jgi:hypothetical protein|nr:hypothetical protein [Bacteroidales bacterium]
MKLSGKSVFLTVLLGVFLSAAYSQEGETKSDVLSFYLDCFHCDFDFVRQELPFISFVRDPLLADVHILVSESNTGGGGEKFFLNFLGRNDLKGVDYEYNITTSQTDTDDDVRRALLKMLKIGMLQYYSKAGVIDQMNVDIEDKGNRKADELTIDRWNKWVFTISAGGELQKEESQSAFRLGTSASASKITEAWKTSFEGYYSIEQEKYIDDDTTISNRQDEIEYSGYFVKSLTEKWSAGIFTTYTSRNYMNLEHKTGLAAGIEYNIFPWKECNRRVFAIQYWAGLNYFDYFETTIYDKLYETLFSEGLEINLELIQPWGEISVGLEGRHYFHDFSKNRLTLESDFSIRLTKNLSVFCELQSEIIHDQLYLPGGDASREDLLLERRKLATTYEIRSQLGFRFTFGSMYNNIVNERF